MRVPVLVLLVAAVLAAGAGQAAQRNGTCTGDSARVWFARDSLADRLTDFFDRAQVSLDYCCYNSSRSDVVQSLISAHNRGVHVRIVTDDRRLDDPWVAQVRSAGIVVWSDSIGPRRTNYMHNKFAVRDLADADSTNDWLWTASYNPNTGDLRADCALEIQGIDITRAYRAEFEQMWGCSGPVPDPGNARFHDAKTDVLPTHEFRVNGHPAFVYFGPQDHVVDTITALAEDAERHLLFAVFAYTWDDLGDAMVSLWYSGGWVGGVIDKSGIASQGAEYPKLVGVGLPVYCDSVPFGEKVLHEKIMVIDSTVTIAGSANWSNNANRYNDENTIVLHDPAIALRFLDELGRRFAEAGGPGIAEPPGSRSGRLHGSVRSPVRSLGRLPDDAELYDAEGRKLESGAGLAPGVYFFRRGNEPASPVTVIR